MKFAELIIYEWYDNIISAFCTSYSGNLYYCNLLAQDEEGVDKIYVCIELKHFEQSDVIEGIIDRQSYQQDELLLQQALNSVKPQNESLLIKARHLGTDSLETISYTKDFNWNHNFFSTGDYPNTLDVAAKLDDWWSYFK